MAARWRQHEQTELLMNQLIQSPACICMIDIEYDVLDTEFVVLKWGEFLQHTPQLIHLNLSGMTV